MKSLIIVGARGFGREVYNLAVKCRGYQSHYSVKGFLDDNKNALLGYKDYPPILSSVQDYQICEEDVFVCALGDVKMKQKYVKMILKKNGEFLTLVHPLASISKNANIGKGCIVFQNTSVGCDSIVGDFALIQNSAVVGHDVKIGDYTRLDSYVVTVGGVIIESNVTIHTSSVINHNVIVGKGSIVGALSFVIRNVKEGATVFGNPAKELT